MFEDFPVEWAGGRAVVALPEHIGAPNAGQVRDVLLSVINRGATTLIADMTATISCDHAGADALIRAWRRAVSSGTQLYLVVTAQIVSRVLDLRGLDRRLVSIYPSLEAAIAASPPVAAPPGTEAAHALAGEPLDAFQDAVALTDSDGTIAAATRQLEDMFGYDPGELPGRSADSLVPDGMQEGHRSRRTAWARAPQARPMVTGGQLAGRRKDGTTFPVRVSLTPVTTEAGPFTLTVIRDITRAGRFGDLAVLARDAAAAEQEHLRLLDRIITGMFSAGLSLQAAMDLPTDVRWRVEAVLDDLDDIIREIRGTAFAARDRFPSAPSGDDD